MHGLIFLMIGLVIGWIIGHIVSRIRNTHIQISGDNSTQVQHYSDKDS